MAHWQCIQCTEVHWQCTWCGWCSVLQFQLVAICLQILPLPTHTTHTTCIIAHFTTALHHFNVFKSGVCNHVGPSKFNPCKFFQAKEMTIRKADQALSFLVHVLEHDPMVSVNIFQTDIATSLCCNMIPGCIVSSSSFQEEKADHAAKLIFWIIQLICWPLDVIV